MAGGELPLHEEPAYLAVKAFESELRKRFQHHQQATIRIGYASDCSGGEAPAVAWQSTIRVLEKLEIISIRFVHEFSSEDPKAHHCHKYIRWNTETRRLYKDLHQRTSDGGPCVFHATDLTEDDEGCIALPPPGDVDDYLTGSECQDLSAANRHGRPLVLDFEAPSNTLGRSSATMIDSLRYVKSGLPRVVTKADAWR